MDIGNSKKYLGIMYVVRESGMVSMSRFDTKVLDRITSMALDVVLVTCIDRIQATIEQQDRPR